MAFSIRLFAVIGAAQILKVFCVSVSTYSNVALSGKPASALHVPLLDVSILGASIGSAELLATLQAPTDGQYSFECQTSNGAVLMWLDDHLFCGTDELFLPLTQVPLPPFAALIAGEPHFLRAQFFHNETSKGNATLSVRWSRDGASLERIPESALSAPNSPAQEARDRLQRTLATGWGTWWRSSALATSLLPEGSTVTTVLCQLSSGKCLDPNATFTPEQRPGQEEPKSEGTSWPGIHAADRSYWQLHLGFQGLNVSLEWAATRSGQGADVQQELSLLATVLSGNSSDFALVLVGDHKFDRPGTVAAGVGQLKLAACGLRTTTVQAVTPQAVGSVAIPAPHLALAFGQTGIAAASTAAAAPSLVALQKMTAAARGAAEVQVDSSVDDSELLSEAANAMLNVNMWNVIYHATQLGPFVQVSRSFTLQPYEIFEWDTFFGALMLSFDERSLASALSSFIQVMKTKTVGPKLDLHGFIPNYSKGGRWLSEDRSERPVGATVLLQIWRRWQHVNGHDLTWLLQLVYPDLLDWHKWNWDQRRLEPLMLGGMGSDTCYVPGTKTKWCKESWGMGELQGARFESLDNSPMYDSPGDDYNFWNATSERMRLYDVGQSSAMVAECDALAQLADILGAEFAGDASLLRTHQAELGHLVSRHMWVESLGVFSNVLLNGTQYPRIAPTSFHTMLAGIATDAQASSMITGWLTNASRFCVPSSKEAWPPATPPTINASEKQCYWGMPSISADDEMYMVAGGTSGIYWRGLTWMPQSFLVFLGLQKYKHLPEARGAISGLVKQQLSLMLSVWRAHHDICENFPSYWVDGAETAGNSCTGNRFYMWGALPAFMALMDAGLYGKTSAEAVFV